LVPPDNALPQFDVFSLVIESDACTLSDNIDTAEAHVMASVFVFLSRIANAEQ